jgi:hypothetical protein
MTYIKEQRRSQVIHLGSDNGSIKSLNTQASLLQMTHPTINNPSQTEKYGARGRMKFVICRNCFWCASLLSAKYFMSENCPNCSLDMLEAIPIA